MNSNASFSPIDSGPLLERELVTEKAKKPAKAYFNWWDVPHIVGNLETGELLGPGKCRESTPYRTAEIAETRARDWIRAHEEVQCPCGFGEHCYLGAYEEGKEP